MNVIQKLVVHRRVAFSQFVRRHRPACIFFAFVVLAPALALAQSGSPFDTGFTALQTLFTGTIAKVASLIAIIIGGYEFAHGAPGAKRSRFGYVAISRASHEATIFTDDVSRLAQQLGTEVSKSSALELVQNLPTTRDQSIGLSL